MFCFSKNANDVTLCTMRDTCWQELGVWGERRQAEAEGAQLHATEAATAAESPGPSGIKKSRGSSWSDSCVLLSLLNEKDWPHFWFFCHYLRTSPTETACAWVNLAWPCLSHISVSSPPAPHQSFSQSKYGNWQTELHNVNLCWWTF